MCAHYLSIVDLFAIIICRHNLWSPGDLLIGILSMPYDRYIALKAWALSIKVLSPLYLGLRTSQYSFHCMRSSRTCMVSAVISTSFEMSPDLGRDQGLTRGFPVTGKDPEELGSSEILLCSAGSKAIASVTTYPHEVVRTRLQIQRSGEGSKGGPSARRTLTEIIKDIAAERGFKGFYRGLTVNLFRTVPASALTILT
jgi:hypothetical protein